MRTDRARQGFVWRLLCFVYPDWLQMHDFNITLTACVSCKYPPCACSPLYPNKQRMVLIHSGNKIRSVLNHILLIKWGQIRSQLSITNQISGELYFNSLSALTDVRLEMQKKWSKPNSSKMTWKSLNIIFDSSVNNLWQTPNTMSHGHPGVLHLWQSTHCLCKAFTVLTYWANMATWNQQTESNLHHVLVLAQTKLHWWDKAKNHIILPQTHLV